MATYVSNSFYFDTETLKYVTRGEVIEITAARAKAINSKLGKDTVTTVKSPAPDLIYNEEDGTTTTVVSSAEENQEEPSDVTESDAAAETTEQETNN